MNKISFQHEHSSRVKLKNLSTSMNKTLKKIEWKWNRDRKERTLSSRRIHSLVLVAVDQWERRSESRTLRAFCDGDSLDMALTLNGSGFTRGSNSTSISFSSFSLSVSQCLTRHPFYITLAMKSNQIKTNSLV